MSQEMHGLLNIFKPSGCTSRDVVNQLQRIVCQGRSRRKGPKLGHAGTLDPLADGVLVVCLGAATRLIRFVQMLPKTYDAGFVLGQVSDTNDCEGEVRHVAAGQPLPGVEEIQAELPRFVGQVMQRPPAFSAVHVDGKRAYAMARKGEEVLLEERPVRIDRVELTRFDSPRLDLSIQCGSGVYIRSIARDLGEQLGCGALMDRLRRTAIGGFQSDQAVSLDSLDSMEAVRAALQPMATAVSRLPQIQLPESQLTRLGNGQAVMAGQYATPPTVASVATAAASECSQSDVRIEYQILDGDGQLRAVATILDDGSLRSTINLP